jgi:2-desacetyl-2-hydroxyethyl bacteriochlorophyllide A dehydrogenase
MKAVMLHGKGDVRVENVPDPKRQDSTDVIVRITTSAICGSDLHPFHGRLPPDDPFPLGHEFVGVVEEVGQEVRGVKRGDRVVAPFSVSCGFCYFCRNRLPAQCETTNHAVFGMGRRGGGWPGAQAQFIRVPYADFMLERIPDDLTDEQALFLGDIFSTGYFCAENAGIRPGDTVAVFGSGPVGLCAQMAAHLFGPALVMAVEYVPYRLEFSRTLGCLPVDAGAADPVEQIRARTHGRGADATLEAVGNAAALQMAIQAVRPGGTISSVGVYVEKSFDFPVGDAFLRDLTLKMGKCNARNYIAPLMPLIQQGRIDPTRIITHRLSLDDAVRGYHIFDQKQERAIKVMLKP